jgi:hypothetical protein
MAGMGLQGAAGAVAGFDGIRKWLADARALQGIEQGNEDRASAIQRQAMLDQRAGETHGLNLERGRQVIDLAAAGEGRTIADEAAEDAARAASGQDNAALEQQIDADPNLSQIQKLVFKASLRRGGSLPAGLLEQPKAPEPKLQFAPDGTVVDMRDPSLAGRNFRAPQAPREPKDEPLVAIKDPVTGQPTLVPRSQARGKAPASTRDQALTEGQSNAAGFADRMKVNETAIQGYESSAAASVGGRIASMLPRDFQSPERQSYDAAKKNWIAAQLRKESGAAISEGEYAEADRQYFPQPGDLPTTIKQKRELRKVAAESMRRSSGHGASAAAPPSQDANDLGAEW